MVLKARTITLTLIEILNTAMRAHPNDPAYATAEQLWNTLGLILVDPLSSANFTLSPESETTLDELLGKTCPLIELTPELVTQGHPQLLVAIEIARCIMHQAIADVLLDPLIHVFLANPNNEPTIRMHGSLCDTGDGPRAKRYILRCFLSQAGLESKRALCDVTPEENGGIIVEARLAEGEIASSFIIMELSPAFIAALSARKEE